MSLFLIELVPADPTREGAQALIETLASQSTGTGAELIESQVTADAGRVFAVLEADEAEALAPLASVDGAAEVTAPAEVRLVGAELADIKAARPHAGYLVEWDLPATLDMDTYLANKKAKSPRYAQVPEVAFLRTYVREDMLKCLCFYDAPDQDTVVRAREVVQTPIDRLHQLA
ncbi:DUF4242 domain-containing protein [Arsenicicoccus cauae]|uniref:DUF4242 domain-containing protein n=1 Tax=Arsenicicoccus cauae TaxID=2663847 RepID=A0A6I3IG44_9MICO|nr:DUF4242 domain-containing protein [Arsenicicoccus cauae]MTB71613.1 DUF4242 domain-containing protein [Arsenicicoccus cauae]